MYCSKSGSYVKQHQPLKTTTMLTPLQKRKQIHFFQILDFDRNGLIQRKDFEDIAENLSVIRSLDRNSKDHKFIRNLSLSIWNNMKKHVNATDGNLDMWLTFMDSFVINSNNEWYDQYVKGMTQTVFDVFDTDRNGYISLDEYLDLFIGLRIEVRFAPVSFEKLDLNSDGKISKSELVKSVEEFLKSDDPAAGGNWLFGHWEL
ncbi:EF-hand domain-containing protein [Reichenbachiella sp. MALMAid0571]|uniref:EF-hand domain-containing protein n=1 Tax=Reichenbachiella sp. MALMAid0571 TaxID=3143939 RepID=UPI0032DE9BA6